MTAPPGGSFGRSTPPAPATRTGRSTSGRSSFYSGQQAVETRDGDDAGDQPESLDPHYQYELYSPRYIDAAILRDENTDADATCDDGRIYYLADANYNVTTLIEEGSTVLEVLHLHALRRANDLHRRLVGDPQHVHQGSNSILSRHGPRVRRGDRSNTTTAPGGMMRAWGGLSGEIRLGMLRESTSTVTAAIVLLVSPIHRGWINSLMSHSSFHLSSSSHRCAVIYGIPIDVRYCGCQETLDAAKEWAMKMQGLYNTCGEANDSNGDPTCPTAREIETCVDLALAMQGITTTVGGTTDALGNVTVNPRPGKCGPLLEKGTEIHEQTHAEQSKELIDQFGGVCPEYRAERIRGSRWANNEVEAYGSEIPFYDAVIAVLDRICRSQNSSTNGPR